MSVVITTVCPDGESLPVRIQGRPERPCRVRSRQRAIIHQEGRIKLMVLLSSGAKGAGLQAGLMRTEYVIDIS